MPKYQLNKWRHPQTDKVRIYLNGLETTEVRVWFERGPRQGTGMPPIYAIEPHSEIPLHDETLVEMREALLEMDLLLDKTDWTRLGKAASW